MNLILFLREHTHPKNINEVLEIPLDILPLMWGDRERKKRPRKQKIKTNAALFVSSDLYLHLESGNIHSLCIYYHMLSHIILVPGRSTVSITEKTIVLLAVRRHAKQHQSVHTLLVNFPNSLTQSTVLLSVEIIFQSLESRSCFLGWGAQHWECNQH